jgi:hypothetical protein
MALTTTPFQAKVLRGMRAEGLAVRRVLRIFPPYDTDDAQEVLFTSLDGRAGTVWVDEQGAVVRGPVPGFGDPLEDIPTA